MDALGSGRWDLHGSEVAAWQRFLASKGFYRGPITGNCDYWTRDATIKFQTRYGLEKDGIAGPLTVGQARRLGFVVPDGRPDRDHFITAHGVDLPSDLREAVRKVAYHYWLWTGESFLVTSGRRTAQSQAEVMYENLQGHHLASYRNGGAFYEILQAYSREQAAGATKHEVIAAMAGVIMEQQRDHVYISLHLLGRAFDVSIRDMRREQIEAFVEAVNEVFGNFRDHMPEDWRRAHHLHVQF